MAKKRKSAVSWTVIVFLLAALTFSIGGSYLQHFYDLTGMSGKRPDSEKADVVDTKEEKKKQPLSTVPFHKQGISAIPAKTALEIDGKADDWDLRTGVLQTNNYIEQSDLLSTWIHFMYDEENFYAFIRARDPNPGNTLLGIAENPVAGQFIQISLQLDQKVAINSWRNENDQPLLQIHYYDPPKKKKKKGEKDEDPLFDSDEEPELRKDATTMGARQSYQAHMDGRGFDLELALPWSMLCKEVKKKPMPGNRKRIGFAARLSAGDVFGSAIKKTRGRHSMGNCSFLREPPTDSTPVRVSNRREFFQTRVDTKRQMMMVDWRRPASDYETKNTELLLSPVKGLKVDGDRKDWNLNAGLFSTTDIRELKRSHTWLHAGYDQEALYLYVEVKDPTPGSTGDQVQIRIQGEDGNKHLIELSQKLKPDGAPTKGVFRIWPDGTGYSVEARVPWAEINAGKVPTRSLAVSCQTILNPHWKEIDLRSVQTSAYSDDKPETWGKTIMLKEARNSFLHPTLFNGKLFPLYLDEDGVIQCARATRRGLNPELIINRQLRAIPGSPKIDGEIGDWDLSGGNFSCQNVKRDLESASGWAHAMYDKDNLYLLFRINDKDPMRRRPNQKVWADDMAQFRINVGSRIFHAALCYFTKKRENGYLIEYGIPPAVVEPQPTPQQHGIQMAFKIAEDKKSYVQEILIPWSTMSLNPFTPKIGQELDFTYVYSTGRRRWVADCFKYDAEYNNNRNIDAWGKLVLMPNGKLAPLPCRLITGQEFPVTMKDGRPVIDWSELK